MAAILGGLATELDPHFNDHYDRDHSSLWSRFEHDAFGFAGGFDPVKWLNWFKGNWTKVLILGGIGVAAVLIFLVIIKL
jgi:hypothetical protein